MHIHDITRVVCTAGFASVLVLFLWKSFSLSRGLNAWAPSKTVAVAVSDNQTIYWPLKNCITTWIIVSICSYMFMIIYFVLWPHDRRLRWYGFDFTVNFSNWNEFEAVLFSEFEMIIKVCAFEKFILISVVKYISFQYQTKTVVGEKLCLFGMLNFHTLSRTD